MYYTQSLIEVGIINFIPFGDRIIEAGNKIIGRSYTDRPKLDKNREKGRIETAGRIHQAIKLGQLDPSYASLAIQMQEKARGKLAATHYTEKQYTLDQISKVLPIVDIVIPGAKLIGGTAIRLVTAQNIVQYARESSDLTETTMKTAKFILPLIASVSSPLWLPYMAPILTLSTVAVAAAGIFGGALALDGINYVLN